MSQPYVNPAADSQSNLDVLLVFPPPWIPFQPYASLPALAGVLRENGIRFECLDASLDLFECFLTSDVLAEYYGQCRNGTNASGVGGSTGLPSLYAEDVIDKIGRVSEVLRGEDFYDPVQRSRALNLLNRSLEIVASAFPGCKLGLDHVSGPWNHRSSEALLTAVRNPQPSPVLDLYERWVIPKILERAPKILGISIVFSDQAFPALLLGQRLKRASPETRIVLGGPFLTANRAAISKPGHPLLEEIADFVVLGEAESAFLRLVQDIIGGEAPANDSPASERLLVGQLEKLDELPTFAYEALPLSSYYSPEPVLTLSTSRGCYWNRCEFCDIQGIGEQGFYRSASPAKVLSDMDYLADTTGARCFSFWDDAVPPKTLKELARLIRLEGREYAWYAQTRADDVFDQATCRSMYEAGCRQVYVGIETGSQRLADRMRKGLDLGRVQKVTGRLSEAGIQVSAGYFFGFPGEQAEDIEATLDFMVSNSAAILPSSASVGAFSLRKDSPLHRNAEKSGVIVTEPEDHDLALDLTFELEDPAQHDRFELAASVRRFLDDQGYSEDQFGPHFLLYQAHSGQSRPSAQASSLSAETSNLIVAEDVQWCLDGSQSVVLAYIPSTSSLLGLDREWLRFLETPHYRSDDGLSTFLGLIPLGLLRRLLEARLLAPTLNRAPPAELDSTQPHHRSN